MECTMAFKRVEKYRHNRPSVTRYIVRLSHKSGTMYFSAPFMNKFVKNSTYCDLKFDKETQQIALYFKIGKIPEFYKIRRPPSLQRTGYPNGHIISKPLLEDTKITSNHAWKIGEITHLNGAIILNLNH